MDNAVWSSWDQSLCDEHSGGRPQILNDEALNAAIEKDNSRTHAELAERLQISSETLNLFLHRTGKADKMSTFTQQDVGSQQAAKSKSFAFSAL